METWMSFSPGYGKFKMCIKECKIWCSEGCASWGAPSLVDASSALDLLGLKRKTHAPFNCAEPTSLNLKRRSWRGVGDPQTTSTSDPAFTPSPAGSLRSSLGPQDRSSRPGHA